MEVDEEMPSRPSTPLPSDQANSATSILPSIHPNSLLAGDSYAHYTPVPSSLRPDPSSSEISSTPCVLGVDEAGRGPVLGPMVYSAFYLPLEAETSLLATTHHFNDSKQLTADVRARLMRQLCTPGTDLHTECGWAIKSLSARDISSGMLRQNQYNLNAQAYDATIEIIKGVIEQGVNVTEVYVDTVGRPETYQKRLSMVFPTIKITVEKKADSKFPCVSAASVVAKVTRDVSLEVLWGGVTAAAAAVALAENADGQAKAVEEEETVAEWGSGYPSDGRCISWLKSDMNPLFGWGYECRFSWGTAKDLLEATKVSANGPAKVDWPVDDDDEGARVTNYFSTGGLGGKPATETEQLKHWFGTSIGQETF